MTHPDPLESIKPQPSALSENDALLPVVRSLTLLTQDLLEDRRAQRRKTYFKLGALGLAGFMVFLVTGSFGSAQDPVISESYASVVRIEGEISPGSTASAEALVPQLEKAFSDERSRGVVLLVNSPGGTPVQSSIVHDRIMALRAKFPAKPVYAVGEDMVTSGAYMIASAAQTIVVNRSTVTGSIGVISRGFGFSGLMEKLGVERRVQAAGDSKNSQDPFLPQTAADKARQSQMLAEVHVHFIETVKASRGDRLKLDTPGLFSGAVWTGERALQAGLVDKLGDLPSVKEELGVTALRDHAPAAPLLKSLLGGMYSQLNEQLFGASVASKVPMAIAPQ